MTLNLPVTVAVGTAAAGVGAAVSGVYMLAGAGWALIVASVPMLAISAVIFRGLLRGTPE